MKNTKSASLHFTRSAIVAFLMLALGAMAVAAQESRGTIIGRITDSSGAAVTGVSVKVINMSTNVVAAAVTNESGSFNIPFLLPGKYRVTAEIANFKKFVQE